MLSEYIARFVTFEDVVNHEVANGSTFCLNSTEYYRNIETKNKKSIKDGAENEAYISTDQSYYTTNEALISCWTKLDNDDHPSQEDWDIFPKEEKRFVAIISNISNVSTLLQRNLQHFTEKKIILDIKGNMVEYYENGRPLNFDMLQIYFYKLKNSYERQREYRFACRLASSCSNVRSLILSVNPSDYISSICCGPELSQEQRNRLLARSGMYKIQCL